MAVPCVVPVNGPLNRTETLPGVRRGVPHSRHLVQGPHDGRGRPFLGLVHLLQGEGGQPTHPGGGAVSLGPLVLVVVPHHVGGVQHVGQAQGKHAACGNLSVDSEGDGTVVLAIGGYV